MALPTRGDDTAPNAPDPRDTSFYPRHRLNQTITHCDLHHNNLGYSGTMGNATHVVHNNFYGNTTGIATDSFFAGGHPGFPQNSSVFEKNNIYSNNFNDYHYPASYPENKKVESTVGVPLGTGILIAGGNDDLVRGNRIYDNWRRGTMLLAVPDALSCPPGTQTCTSQNPASTSYDTEYHNNTMGLAPGGNVKLNGVDFWWDEFPNNTGDCWSHNIGPDGTNASWTGDPQRFPQPNRSVPHFLPEDCATSVGTGNPDKEAVLAYCANAAIGDTSCEWYTQPPRPGTKAAKTFTQREAQRAKALVVANRFRAPACELVSTTHQLLGLPQPTMRPPFAEGIATGAWRGVGAPVDGPLGIRERLGRLGARGRLVCLAAVVLMAALATAGYVAERPFEAGPTPDAPGTAFLGTATCADWQAAGDARRLTMIGALATAATQPDPENPGATLSEGAAYGLFERACATRASRPVLLYETYNRAASMSAARAAGTSGFGTSTHR